MQELDDVVLVDQNDDMQVLKTLICWHQERNKLKVQVLQQERRKNDVQEEKSPKKSTKVENMMEKYLEMRTKQAEDESAQLVKEEYTQGVDFSIKKCIAVLRSMEVT
jgi:hypothetical protein